MPKDCHKTDNALSGKGSHRNMDRVEYVWDLATFLNQSQQWFPIQFIESSFSCTSLGVPKAKTCLSNTKTLS